MIKYFYERASQELLKRRTSLAYNSQWEKLHLDPTLGICLLLLCIISLISLYSAADGASTYVRLQASYYVLGTVVLLVCAQIKPDVYLRYTPILFYLSLLILLYVLFMGSFTKGATRWINLGFIKIQPSELVKITTPLMVAWYVAHKNFPITTRHALLGGLIVLIPVLLVIKQPDLGTAIIILMSGSIIIFFAGLSYRLISSCLLLLLGAAPLVWHYLLHGYQKQRILTFLNPEKDPFGSGYHIIQSKIAIGSGGLTGKGWLAGTQSHLNYIPEHHTDFIFALIGEEFGLLGVGLVIALYLIIALRCLLLASILDDRYRKLLLSGLCAIVFFSAFINMGMVVGLLPVTGIPLPIISKGGSAVVSTFIIFGLLMSFVTQKQH